MAKICKGLICALLAAMLILLAVPAWAAPTTQFAFTLEDEIPIPEVSPSPSPTADDASQPATGDSHTPIIPMICLVVSGVVLIYIMHKYNKNYPSHFSP